MARPSFMARSGWRITPVDASNVAIRIYSESLYSGDVTVSISGATPAVISLTGKGTDGLGGADDSGDANAPAIYSGVADVTIPIAFQQFTWTATQVGNTSGGLDPSGSFYNDPTENDDYSILITSCDNIHEDLGQDINKQYGIIRNRADPYPVVAWHNIEDIDYVDQFPPFTDVGSGRNVQYLPDNGVGGSYTAYSYHMGHARYHGLLEDGASIDLVAYDNDRQAMYMNYRFSAACGDHEEVNNPEEEIRIQARRTVAIQAYNEVWGELNPVALEASSVAWAYTLADLQFIAFDRMSNASTVTTPVWDIVTYTSNGVEWLGDGQIDAAKAAYDTSAKFTFMSAPMAMRAVFSLQDLRDYNNPAIPPSLGDAWIMAQMGVQQPLEYYQPAEYERLFLGDDGLLVKSKQFNKPFIGLHGDVHRKEEISILGSVERIMQFSPGSVAGFINHICNADALPPHEYDTVRFSYMEPTVSTTKGQPNTLSGHIRIDHIATPRQVIVNMFDDDGLLLRTGTFTDTGGNISSELLGELPMSKYSQVIQSNPRISSDIRGDEVVSLSEYTTADPSPTDGAMLESELEKAINRPIAALHSATTEVISSASFPDPGIQLAAYENTLDTSSNYFGGTPELFTVDGINGTVTINHTNVQDTPNAWYEISYFADFNPNNFAINDVVGVQLTVNGAAENTTHYQVIAALIPVPKRATLSGVIVIPPISGATVLALKILSTAGGNPSGNVNVFNKSLFIQRISK